MEDLNDEKVVSWDALSTGYNLGKHIVPGQTRNELVRGRQVRGSKVHREVSKHSD